MASPSPDFRNWLRDGLSLAMTEWADHGALPAERDLEETFRARIAAQHGWSFENAWPSAAELESIAEARAELSEPIEQGRARREVRLNARRALSRVEQ